jgi:hypothetical protein
MRTGARFRKRLAPAPAWRLNDECSPKAPAPRTAIVARTPARAVGADPKPALPEGQSDLMLAARTGIRTSRSPRICRYADGTISIDDGPTSPMRPRHGTANLKRIAEVINGDIFECAKFVVKRTNNPFIREKLMR